MFSSYKYMFGYGIYYFIRKNEYILETNKEPVHIIGNGWASYHFVKSLNKNLDVIVDALAERFKAPIETFLNDDSVDIVMVIVTPQLVTQIEETARLIIDASKVSSKPIYAVMLGGKYIDFGLQRLLDNKSLDITNKLTDINV